MLRNAVLACLVVTALAVLAGLSLVPASWLASAQVAAPVRTPTATAVPQPRFAPVPLVAPLHPHPAPIPETARAAYHAAASLMRTADAGCHLRWPLLAAAGWVESRHGARTRHGRGPFDLSRARWRLARVDADSDGSPRRQDVDDAALAYAVLLCAGEVDLRRQRLKRVALRRIDPQPYYAAEVLVIARYYRTHG